MSSGLDSRDLTPLPEAGQDPSDPNQPLYDFHDPPTAPVSNPTADMDSDQSDNDSILSDVDEAQFEDFDPANVAIDDRPAIAVDEDNVRLLGRHIKRKREEEPGDGEGGKRKKREGKREKPKKPRKQRDDDEEDDFSGGQELEGKRARRKKSITEGGSGPRKATKAKARNTTPENEDSLDPEESELGILVSMLSGCTLIHFALIGRRRALDRKMDAALKNPTKRPRRADGIVGHSSKDQSYLPLAI